ncbi:MAG: hypothetical protein WB420_22795, partial [Bradyrhizobium sp.]
RQWVPSEHRKNGREFPVLPASHQRFVAGKAFSGEAGNRSREEKASKKRNGSSGQQYAEKEKAGARQAVSQFATRRSRRDQYLATTGAPKW